jgi:hypothetical protein
MHLLGKPVAHPFRFRQDLKKARRKSAGDSDSAIRRINHCARAIVGVVGPVGNWRACETSSSQWEVATP